MNPTPGTDSTPALRIIPRDQHIISRANISKAALRVLYRLHDAGYADPGRAPNYWKSYPFDKFSDTAIASELLTILHDVYGYAGATKLKILTEAGRAQ